MVDLALTNNEGIRMLFKSLNDDMCDMRSAICMFASVFLLFLAASVLLFL